MALGLTQPLTEMSTRNISWGVKAAGAYGRQPYHLHVPIVLKSGSLNHLGPSGPIYLSIHPSVRPSVHSSVRLSVHPSVRPSILLHGTTRLPLDGFS